MKGARGGGGGLSQLPETAIWELDIYFFPQQETTLNVPHSHWLFIEFRILCASQVQPLNRRDLITPVILRRTRGHHCGLVLRPGRCVTRRTKNIEMIPDDYSFSLFLYSLLSSPLFLCVPRDEKSARSPSRWLPDAATSAWQLRL